MIVFALDELLTIKWIFLELCYPNHLASCHDIKGALYVMMVKNIYQQVDLVDFECAGMMWNAKFMFGFERFHFCH